MRLLEGHLTPLVPAARFDFMGLRGASVEWCPGERVAHGFGATSHQIWATLVYGGLQFWAIWLSKVLLAAFALGVEVYTERTPVEALSLLEVHSQTGCCNPLALPLPRRCTIPTPAALLCKIEEC